MKTEIYQSLYNINQCLQLVTEELPKLKQAQVIPEMFAKIRCIAADLMRSEINCRAAITLHTRELEDSSRLEKEHIVQQKQIAASSLASLCHISPQQSDSFRSSASSNLPVNRSKFSESFDPVSDSVRYPGEF